jgi:TatD DNase family protein
MQTNKYKHYLDMHCHYDQIPIQDIKLKFKNETIIAIAQSTNIEDYRKYLEIKKENIENLYFGYGLYPDNVLKKDFEKIEKDLEEINFNEALVIGEIGMDKKITENPFNIALQEKLFRKQIEIASSLNKPIVVHTRGAVKESLEILKSYPEVKTILHWFTAEKEDIQEALSRGYFLTERFAKPKIENIEYYLDQIFIETDLPVWQNGKETTIESIKESYDVFSKKYNIPLEKVKEKTINNFLKLFPTIDT